MQIAPLPFGNPHCRQDKWLAPPAEAISAATRLQRRREAPADIIVASDSAAMSGTQPANGKRNSGELEGEFESAARTSWSWNKFPRWNFGALDGECGNWLAPPG